MSDEMQVTMLRGCPECGKHSGAIVRDEEDSRPVLYCWFALKVGNSHVNGPVSLSLDTYLGRNEWS